MNATLLRPNWFDKKMQIGPYQGRGENGLISTPLFSFFLFEVRESLTLVFTKFEIISHFKKLLRGTICSTHDIEDKGGVGAIVLEFYRWYMHFAKLHKNVTIILIKTLMYYR